MYVIFKWMYVTFEGGCFFLFKQRTAYERRISDWSSDVCSSDLLDRAGEIEARIADREIDAAARAALERASALADQGQIIEAEHAVAEMASRNPPWPDRWQQAAVLRQASYKRRLGDYRSEERRVGKEWVSTCSTRGAAEKK